MSFCVICALDGQHVHRLYCKLKDMFWEKKRTIKEQIIHLIHIHYTQDSHDNCWWNVMYVSPKWPGNYQPKWKSTLQFELERNQLQLYHFVPLCICHFYFFIGGALALGSTICQFMMLMSKINPYIDNNGSTLLACLYQPLLLVSFHYTTIHGQFVHLQVTTATFTASQAPRWGRGYLSQLETPSSKHLDYQHKGV